MSEFEGEPGGSERRPGSVRPHGILRRQLACIATADRAIRGPGPRQSVTAAAFRRHTVAKAHAGSAAEIRDRNQTDARRP